MSAVLQSEICATSEAFGIGRQWGAYYKGQGIDYGKANGSYPSNPYHVSDPRCAEYDAGYETGFAE